LFDPNVKLVQRIPLESTGKNRKGTIATQWA